MDRTRGVEPGRWWAAFTFVVPILYGLILSVCARRIGTADYDQFVVFHELQYWNANLFGLAKQWSPVMCSGLSLAGEPQVPFASLTMLMSYLLSPVPGIVLGTLLYLGIGWLGGYLYSGLCFEERRLRLLAASLFIGNGFFICRIAHGHLDFIPFAALPLALWVIHRVSNPNDTHINLPTRLLGVVMLGCLIAAAIDGSPVSIIHWAFWIAVYSVVLSWTRRSAWPALAFLGACLIASVLDAGYLWPMLVAQDDFPRRTADSFTGPWSLPWFLLIPMRGKVLPANGTGIELSVFIGPFLAFLIWRYRDVWQRQLPRELKTPLLVVSCLSIWLGMGSLRAVHLPLWMSPFDWLRPLPGFRSIGITGRFWGFLALPLSLLAASSLWQCLHAQSRGQRRTLLLSGALILQLAFQGESLLSAWWPSRAHQETPLLGLYNGHPRALEQVINPSTPVDVHRQGEFISPVRAVINCYDMDDFTRAPVSPGTSLIKDTRAAGFDAVSPSALTAGLVTWNRIRITALSEPVAPQIQTMPVSYPGPLGRDSVLQITLNQAYHSGWSSADCTLTRGAQDHLVALCPLDTLRARSVDLNFFDPVSALGTRVSLRAAGILVGTVLVLGLLSLAPRRRPLASPAS